jgi:serine/threonine protein kinase
MMKPPKGMRTYPLQPDPAVVEMDPTPVSGGLVVMLRATHSDRRTGPSTHWRLELVRAVGLAHISPPATGAPPTTKPPNCFVEAYWKGPGVRDKAVEQVADWTLVGHTATKQSCDCPLFEKDADGSVMELPPAWTDLPVPRSHHEEHVQQDGGWVPRNCVPLPPPEEDAEVAADGASGKRSQVSANEKRFPFGAKSEEEVVQFRTVMRYNELVKLELQARLEALRYLYLAEERERKCMAQEERQFRSTALSRELERSQALVTKQTEFSRSFMRLLHLVQAPPNILARLRFLMGEDSRGGGQKVMCEDPATGKIFHVVATPILRKEDEAFMLEQLNRLFTTACPNLVRVVDFSVHQLRDFTDKGFSSVDERMAIAVLDYIEGCTVLQFVQRNWESLTNDAFREVLCQIAGALKALHQAGVVHRNFHPEAVVVELPHSRATIKKRTGGTAKVGPKVTAADRNKRSAAAKLLNDMLVCYVGDYWFLHNPRTVACESSVGRADWGAPMTAPPEAILAEYGTRASTGAGAAAKEQTLSRIAQVEARRSASADTPHSVPGPRGHTAAPTRVPSSALRVTASSDMYAFGVCLYYWATNGLHRSLPIGSDGLVDLNAVKRNLPLKWKPWLHSLFDMCLQVRPENRASSNDVHVFLSSRYGK